MLSHHVIGCFWYVVLALGLLQLMLADKIHIPWMPADKVHLPEGKTWVLWILLVVFLSCSAIPFDRLKMCYEVRLGWVRFVAAAVQGLILGYLIVFDLSTLLARFFGAIFLGVANALDRLYVLRRMAAVADTSVSMCEGSGGILQKDGRALAIEVRKVSDDRVTVYFTEKPFWYNYEVIQANNPDLQLTVPSETTTQEIINKMQRPSFQLRPWGYAFGVSLSQWLIVGFSKADSFVAGMLTQDAIIIGSVPILVAVGWCVCKSTESENVKTVLILLFVGCVLIEIVAFAPMMVGIVTFAAVQLFAHQVVAFIAIPADALVYLAVTKPSVDNLTKTLLSQTLLRAEALTPSDVRASSCAQRALPS